MLPPNLFTWLKLAAALALVLAIAAGYAWWRHINAEAALVPALSSRIASDDARATALAARLAQIDKARAAAESTLGAWQAQKAVALQSLAKDEFHAPAQTNPVCAPTALDRGLRNDALARLTGFDRAGSEAELSGGAARAH